MTSSTSTSTSTSTSASASTSSTSSLTGPPNGAESSCTAARMSAQAPAGTTSGTARPNRPNASAIKPVRRRRTGPISRTAPTHRRATAANADRHPPPLHHFAAACSSSYTNSVRELDAFGTVRFRARWAVAPRGLGGQPVRGGPSTVAAAGARGSGQPDSSQQDPFKQTKPNRNLVTPTLVTVADVATIRS